MEFIFFFFAVVALDCQTTSTAYAVTKIADCINYHTDAMCAACNNKKYPTAANNACQACGTVIPGCLECFVTLAQTQCKICEDGKLPSIDRTQCVECDIAGCEKCNTDGTCTVCIAPKVPNPSGTACQDCSVQMPGCESCWRYNRCRKCGCGKYLKSDFTSCVESCTEAIQDCATCEIDASGFTVCTSCVKPKLLSNHNTCITCTGKDCETCNGWKPSECMTCPWGKYLKSDRTACLDLDDGNHTNYFIKALAAMIRNLLV